MRARNAKVGTARASRPALWGIVDLGILPDTKGPNLYGADPAQLLA